MRNQSKSRQRGISFLGLVFVGAVLAVVGVVAAQVFPTFVEYQAVVKAVSRASSGSTVPEVRALYERSAEVDNITSMKAKDLDITKDGETIVVKFAYEREIHLAGPAYLTLKYRGQSK
ncbi:MAG: DUF4845 domain-containing protein [Burkholderiaceae bacterium]